MNDHCRWVRDHSVPNGRYLVPGCWSRVVYGDGAECTCSEATVTDWTAEEERVARALVALAAAGETKTQKKPTKKK